jgi:ABC-type amino acid transport substrate-binding protein
MKRSLLVLSLVILIGLVLSACAQPEPAPAPVPTAAPAAQPAPTEAPEPTKAPEQTAAPKPTEAPAAQPTAAPAPTAVSETVAPAVEAAKTLRLPDLKGRKVAAVTENAYTPLNFVDPATGKAAGWEYDAVNEICRRLNCTVDWKLSSWDAMIPAVKDGQFDVGMDGITINDERKQQVDFSDPYMTSQQFMLVRADENRFTDAKAFAADPKLLIGAQAGTTNFYSAVYNVLDGDEANPRIKLFETFGASVQALLTGDVDMVLTDAASGRGYVGANPDKLKIVGDPIGSDDFGFIFKQGSDLVQPFNAAIAQMKADGYLDYLNNRWFFLTDPAGKDVYHQLPDLKGRKVAAVTENAYTPLNFVDPATGKAAGWEYDAVNEICRRLNCAVDWKLSSWDAMIPAVKDGQFDVGMDGITINDERKTQVDFSDPYMTSQQFMLVRADEDQFKDAKEFGADPKLLIGAQAGTTNFYSAVYNVLDGDEANPRIKLFETFGASVQALLAGDVDMVLTDAASGRGYIGANPDKLKIVGDPIGSDDFGFIFKQGSDLVKPFNAAIATMKKDGFMDHLNNRWFFLYDANSK